MTQKFQTLAFYKYVELPNPHEFAEQHLKFCKKIEIKCRIYVSEEGINGSVSGTPNQCQAYIDYMQQHPIFSDMPFKIDEDEVQAFWKTHVRYRPELVHFGQPQVKPHNTATHLSPQKVLEMQKSGEAVMLDVRNRVEYEVGKFKDALTLPIETFRELPNHLEALEPYKNKTIIAYCTGGIRCEKATAFLKEQGFDNIFQIDGGLLNYAHETGGENFDGKCYVFDKRVVADINNVNPTIISVCRVCQKPSARMVNCANPTCNEHFVLCETCGNELQGCCSSTCQQHPRVRTYDGTGYYARTGKQL